MIKPTRNTKNTNFRNSTSRGPKSVLHTCKVSTIALVASVEVVTLHIHSRVVEQGARSGNDAKRHAAAGEVARDPASGEGASGDDLDVYYERGRRPKESRMKYEAMRSKGDYRREVLLARLCAGHRGQGRGARGQGRREGRRCSCCLERTNTPRLRAFFNLNGDLKLSRAMAEDAGRLSTGRDSAGRCASRLLAVSYDYHHYSINDTFHRYS